MIIAERRALNGSMGHQIRLYYVVPQMLRTTSLRDPIIGFDQRTNTMQYKSCQNAH